MNSRFLRNGIVTLVLVVGIAALLYMVLFPPQTTNQIAYAGGSDSFLGLVKEGAVKSVTQQGNQLEIVLSKPLNGQTTVQSQVPGQLGDGLYRDMQAVCAQPGAACGSSLPPIYASDPPQTGQWLGLLLTTLVPVILIGAFLFIMFRQAQGTNNQAMSFGKSRARMFLGNKTVVTFNDVAGVDEAKTELQEVVEFLKYPEKFNSLGARIPRGVLLVGPPGTGKTLLARAVAGEAGVPFFSISGSEFVEMFVGVGASRVRDLFDQAKRNSPCIVFVDEVGQIRATEARRGARDRLELERLVERLAPDVHLQDLQAPAHVGPVQDHLAVEAARAQERGVEHVGAVRGGHHDDVRVRVEAVHLDEDLVQRLLALVVRAAQARPALPAHRVDLVDEDDAGAVALGLVEEVAHP